MDKSIGGYSFIFGVILAVILGVVSTYLPKTIGNLTFLVLLLVAVIIGVLNGSREFLLDFAIVKKMVAENKQVSNLINNGLVIYVASTVTIILSKYFFQNDNLSHIDLLIFSRDVLIIVFITILVIYTLMILSFALYYMIKMIFKSK